MAAVPALSAHGNRSILRPHTSSRVEGGREGGITQPSTSLSPSCFHPWLFHHFCFRTPKQALTTPSFFCLFLRLSPADNVKNWDFSCTGDSLGQETFSNSRGSVIPNPLILPVTGPQQQAGLAAWGNISPAAALLFFYSSPSSPSPETISRSSLTSPLFPTGFYIPLPADLVYEVVV